jgi:hypothetical protein
MVLRHRLSLGVGAVLAVAIGWSSGAAAQTATLSPIPPGECQTFAVQVQNAIGMAARASEDDFTDLTDNSEGRSCHIAASASGQSFATPGDLITRVATVFPGWTDEPARTADGPDGTEKGYVKGDRVATVDVSWEPGPGVTCSDKEPLSACKILPQQKLWNVIVDIVVKGGK